MYLDILFNIFRIHIHVVCIFAISTIKTWFSGCIYASHFSIRCGFFSLPFSCFFLPGSIFNTIQGYFCSNVYVASLLSLLSSLSSSLTFDFGINFFVGISYSCIQIECRFIECKLFLLENTTVGKKSKRKGERENPIGFAKRQLCQ